MANFFCKGLESKYLGFVGQKAKLKIMCTTNITWDETHFHKILIDKIQIIEYNKIGLLIKI